MRCEPGHRLAGRYNRFQQGVAVFKEDKANVKLGCDVIFYDNATLDSIASLS